MSGRKSWEVAGVLEQGEKVRKLTDNLLSGEIDKEIKIILDNIKKSNETQNRTNALEINIESEAAEMFKEKAQKVKDEFNDLKIKIASLSFNEGNVNKIKSELRKMDEALNAADREAREIRESIKGKHHYCTPEFNRAKELVKVYQKLRDSRMELAKNAADLTRETREILSQIAVDYNKMTDLKLTAENMNDTAKKHKESNEMRESLKEKFGAINVQNAEKFLRDDYNNLRSEIEKSVSLNDDELIAKFNEKCEIIINFTSNLNDKIRIWEKQKADAEALLNDAIEKANFALIGPVEYYNKKENGDKTELFEYLKEYADEDYLGEYEDLISAGKKLIKTEEFVKSAEPLSKAIKLVSEARDKATLLQEKMLKKTELAGVIQDVMHDELNYEVTTEFIDGNPANGYRIICESGDEVIEFDKIDIDDDGNIIVNIDHKEAMGGTCSSSWKEIRELMMQRGIPITDVLKDGETVIFKKKRSEGDNNQIQKQNKSR